jgi:DNA-binding NarL/FixJ family response regulator
MKPVAPQICEAVLHDYRAGDKVISIAAEYGVSPSFVSTLAKQHGLGRGRKGGAGGAKHPRQVEIMRAYLSGMGPTQIAQQFGCHYKSVRRMVFGRDESTQRYRTPVQLELFA